MDNVFALNMKNCSQKKKEAGNLFNDILKSFLNDNMSATDKQAFTNASKLFIESFAGFGFNVIGQLLEITEVTKNNNEIVVGEEKTRTHLMGTSLNIVIDQDVDKQVQTSSIFHVHIEFKHDNSTIEFSCAFKSWLDLEKMQQEVAEFQKTNNP